MPSAAISNPQLQFTSNDFDFGIIIEIMDDASEPTSYLASDNYYDTGISDSQISYLKDYQISYLTRLPTNIRAVQTFARAALLLQQSIVGLPFVAIYR